MKRILLVDDEPQILRVLRMPLRSSGFEVLTASNGQEGLREFRVGNPDLIVTDLSMPVMDGLEFTRAIRETSDVPIIVLSVRNTEAMKVQALDSGADDYLTKPFSTPELLARVRAQVRRSASAVIATPQEFGDFAVDESLRAVRVRGRAVHLTPKEFDLLLAFISKADRTLPHSLLVRDVWGSSAGYTAENLRVLVGTLRKKLELMPDKQYIVSEPWVGYRFCPDGCRDPL